MKYTQGAGVDASVLPIGPRRDEISLMALGTILLRRRWQILRLAAIGGLVGLAWAWSRPPKYAATASFVSVAADMNRSGLASLAGQFGVAIPTAGATVSPEFYAGLVHSRTLLLPIARDTFAVAERGGQRVAMADLLEVDEAGQGARDDEAVKGLRRMVSASTVKATGLVTITVKTPWRSVSLEVARALVDGVNGYNQQSRQSQGAAERRFVEGRLDIARTELRAAEERLANFLERNRRITNAPDLVLQRERLERDVSFRQQVYTGMIQSYEEARLREVRDTPVISIVEAPWAPVKNEPRGRFFGLLLGGFLAGLIGIMMAVAQELTRRRRREGDPDADEFLGTLHEVRRQIFRLGRRPS